MVIILNLALLLKYQLVTGMKSDEDLEFIKLTSLWRKGIDFPIDDYLFYNFGYEKEFPYAKVDLSLEKDIDIGIKTNGMEAPSGCNIVLIAGKYVKQVDQVMKRMDDIAEQTQFVPLAAFIFDEHAIVDVELRFVEEVVSYIYWTDVIVYILGMIIRQLWYHLNPFHSFITCF